jgi:hypothetical protein
MSTYK